MEKCPDCKCEFTRLGSHWAISDCDYPSFTNEQRNIITGVLMGDGWIKNKRDRNPYFAVSMINEDYLDYLNNKLSLHAVGVSHTRSAEESASMAKKSGLHKSAESENYNDLFTLRSRSNPNLKEFAEWYDSGEKVFPDSINMNPTVMKHWYICDGHKHRDGYIQIGVSNEKENFDKLCEYFNSSGLPEPKLNKYNNNAIIRWTVDESKDLLEYMGNSITGFEYKW